MTAHILTYPAEESSPHDVYSRIGDRQRAMRAQPFARVSRISPIEFSGAAPYGAENQVWVLGCCQFGCGVLTGRVLYIGPAMVNGYPLPLYICGNCVGLLLSQAYAYNRIRDGLLSTHGLYDVVAAHVARKAA